MSKDQEQDRGAQTGRPYLSILFDCCRVYVRVYRKANEDRYQARCPKCLKKVTIGIDPQNGTSCRFFRAY